MPIEPGSNASVSDVGAVRDQHAADPAAAAAAKEMEGEAKPPALNPFKDPFPASSDSEDDLEILGDEGDVPTRDYPHSRPDCAVHTFVPLVLSKQQGSASNAEHCPQCYCYVCDCPATSCTHWGLGARPYDHCHAYDDSKVLCQSHWLDLRKAAKREGLAGMAAKQAELIRQRQHPAPPPLGGSRGRGLAGRKSLGGGGHMSWLKQSSLDWFAAPSSKPAVEPPAAAAAQPQAPAGSQQQGGAAAAPGAATAAAAGVGSPPAGGGRRSAAPPPAVAGRGLASPAAAAALGQPRGEAVAPFEAVPPAAAAAAAAGAGAGAGGSSRGARAPAAAAAGAKAGGSPYAAAEQPRSQLPAGTGAAAATAAGSRVPASAGAAGGGLEAVATATGLDVSTVSGLGLVPVYCNWQGGRLGWVGRGWASLQKLQQGDNYFVWWALPQSVAGSAGHTSAWVTGSHFEEVSGKGCTRKWRQSLYVDLRGEEAVVVAADGRAEVQPARGVCTQAGVWLEAQGVQATRGRKRKADS